MAELNDVAFDPATGGFTADLRVFNNGAALSRNIAVVLTGLPAGVTFPGASGTDSSGIPMSACTTRSRRGARRRRDVEPGGDHLERPCPDPVRALGTGPGRL